MTARLSNTKYIRIRSIHQTEGHNQYDSSNFFINIEDFFIKRDIEYEIEPDSRKVYVDTKHAALRLGLGLQLKAIEYFNGMTLETISLRKNSTNKRKQTVYVENLDMGIKKTLKQFKSDKKIRAESEGILKSEIISSKLATKKDLERMIIKYNLHVTKFGGKLYLDQLELAKALTAGI